MQIRDQILYRKDHYFSINAVKGTTGEICRCLYKTESILNSRNLSIAPLLCNTSRFYEIHAKYLGVKNHEVCNLLCKL